MSVVLGSGGGAGKHGPGLDSFSERNHINVTVTCGISIMRTAQSWCGYSRGWSRFFLCVSCTHVAGSLGRTSF
jgi:hypothetical protein